MRFPLVVFLVICGGFLVTGGTLIGSEITLGFGIAFWVVAVGVVVHAAVRLAADAWQDWQLKRHMADLRKRTPKPAPRWGIR